MQTENGIQKLKKSTVRFKLFFSSFCCLLNTNCRPGQSIEPKLNFSIDVHLQGRHTIFLCSIDGHVRFISFFGLFFFNCFPSKSVFFLVIQGAQWRDTKKPRIFVCLPLPGRNEAPVENQSGWLNNFKLLTKEREQKRRKNPR